jgi:peptidoglycan/LPS O-acetylase OafA/YrhL
MLYAIAAMSTFVLLRYGLNGILAFARSHIEGFIRHDVAFQHSFYRWLFYFSPYARMFEFITGCLAAHAFVLARDRQVSAGEYRWGVIALFSALAFLVIAGLFYTDAITIDPINPYVRHLALNFLCAPAIAVILFCVSRYETRFATLMSSTVLVGLGETSYSIYMVHTWTLRIFNHPAPPLNLASGIETVLRVLVAIVFTIIVSYATYRLIEVPARARLRAVFTRWIDAGFRDLAVPNSSTDRQEIAGTSP